SISPGISFPIFEGGRLRANLEASKARYQQAVAAYVNQVLIAYGDVEDALTDLHALSDEVGTLRDAVSASQNYLRLAQVQYKQGLAVATFLASAVEFVEAFTIVLAMGLSRSWRAALMGTASGLLALAAVTAIAGVALIQWISESMLQLVIGTLLLLFGLQWL